MVLCLIIFMPGPYDYTVNIPQPPAQNFLQSLMGIQQLKGLQQQQDIQGQQAQQQSVVFNQAQEDRTRILQEQATAKERTQQLFKELQSMPADASLEQVFKITNKLALVNPAAAKQVGENYSKLSDQLQNNAKLTAAKAGALLEAGENERAAAVYDEAAKAIENTEGGNPISKNLIDGYKIQASMARSNPNAAKLGVTTLLGVVDPTALNAITSAKKEAVKESEKSLPSALLRENAAIDKKVSAANDMADKLSQAAEAMRVLPSVGSAKEWWTNVKPKLGFGENPEIAVRTNAAQLAGLGMLGSESSAMGGAIRSNVQFQYATSKLPDAWSAPQELAKRLDAQAEVQSKLAKLMTIDAEWNSAFRGSQKANKDEQILGIDVTPGMTKSQFKEMAAKQLFPAKGNESPAPAPTRTDKITGTPDLTAPQSRSSGMPSGSGGADFGLFNINGEEVKVRPRGK